MKKLLVTILALIYLGSSTGAMMHLHYCMGKLAETSFSKKNNATCNKCGMKTTQKKNDEQMWKEWASAGIKIIDLTPEERKAWISAIGPNRPEWLPLKEKYGSSLLEQIAKFA